MTELGTALRQLADRQQPVGGQDPSDLWSRGRQRVRRRRAIGAAVAAVVVAAVGLGTLFIQEPVVVMPAGQVHAPGYPDQVYRPSRWLASTGDKGPLGQLAVIAPAEHHSETAIFGVSATTGEYRFLDLPGWVVGSHVSLAPDGKHVAYWTTGHTSKTPYPDPGLAADGRTQAIAGMAIYDTVTGKVQRTPILTQHGMSDEGLSWLDSTTVYFGDWQLKGRHGASRSQFFAVKIGVPTAKTVPDTYGEFSSARTSDGSRLTSSDDGLTWYAYPIIDPGFSQDLHFTLPKKLPEKHSTGGDATYTYVSRTPTKVIVEVNDTPSLTDTLMTGDIAPNRQVTNLTLVGDRFQNVIVLGWHGDHTLLAYGLDRKLHQILASVDVNTGAVTKLSRIREQGWGDQLVPALDVLHGDVVHGLKPPTPMDPRKKNTLIVLGSLALAGGVLVLIRRRRRA